jgi:hypothetical protein
LDSRWIRHWLEPELQKNPAVYLVDLPHPLLENLYVLPRRGVLPLRYSEPYFQRTLRMRAAVARAYQPANEHQMYWISVYDAAGQDWRSKPMRVRHYQRDCLGEALSPFLPDEVDAPEELPLWGGDWDESGRVLRRSQAAAEQEVRVDAIDRDTV